MKKPDTFIIRALFIPGILMFLLDHFWFGFQLTQPFPKLILAGAGVCGFLFTVYQTLTSAATYDTKYAPAATRKSNLYRLQNMTFGDLLTNVVLSILFAYAGTICVNGLIPIRTVGRDTVVLDVKTHRSSSRNGRGSTETHTLDVSSWLVKGETLTLSIDRKTGLKLNQGAPIHIDTKIGLLGLEFYRARHQSFTFQKGYKPPFTQPD